MRLYQCMICLPLTTLLSVNALNLSGILNRRSVITGTTAALVSSLPTVSSASASSQSPQEPHDVMPSSNLSSNPTQTTNINSNIIDSLLKVVTDPQTYSALAYAPPNNNKNTPLILLLHGAGMNDKDILRDLADPYGEHAGLIPSLIASHTAPSNLLNNFCVLAPYSYGKSSFYEEPRKKILDFVDWAIRNQNTEDVLPLQFDPNRIILFGFSDGATVAIELLTTRRFSKGVICSYGYSGQSLPSTALERLSNLPLWVFHSQDDVIFNVHNSDRLVQQLEMVNNNNINNDNNSSTRHIVRYSRYDRDPENLPSRVKGHSMGITASKSSDLYDWMIQ
jgi:predicted peptidase